MRDAFIYGWRLSELRGDQATAAMGAVLGHGQREDVELGRIELLHVRLILPDVAGPPAVGAPDPVPRRHIRSVLRRAARLVYLRLIGRALVAHLDLRGPLPPPASSYRAPGGSRCARNPCPSSNQVRGRSLRLTVCAHLGGALIREPVIAAEPQVMDPAVDRVDGAVHPLGNLF